MLATLAAAAMVLAGAGSAAGPRPAKSQISLGPGVVKQIGKRNYVGPNCPGRGWNCTNAKRVLQIATTGGQNVAYCNSGRVLTPSSASCVITQSGSYNLAWCLQRISGIAAASQSCVITQNGAKNQAAVYQQIGQGSGSAQTASQKAMVTQGPKSGGTAAANDLALIQIVSQSTGSSGDDDDDRYWSTDSPAPAPSQSQDAWQSAIVSQSALGSGRNWSDIHQSQGQNAVNGVVQSQNTGASPLADCSAPFAPSSPNACVNLTQNGVAGKNTSGLHQTIVENATSPVVASQTQGAVDGGIEGNVHQETAPASGSSVNVAGQVKRQRAIGAPGSIQSQHDPVRCCGSFSQVGGTGNSDTIDQTSNQFNSDDDPQSASLIGESVSPNGACTINHHITENDASSSRSASQSPSCAFLVLATSCGSSGGEGGCTETPPVTERGTPVSELDKLVRNKSAGVEIPTPTTEAAVDDELEFQIRYTNVGTASAHEVVVTDVVPSTFTFSSCSAPTGASCSFNELDNTVTWTLGTVSPDSSMTMSFTAFVAEAVCSTENTAQATTKEEGEPTTSTPATVHNTDGC